jgi:hypothetical protein
VLHSWIELLMWKMSLPYLDRRSRNQNSISFRIPLVEPELSPVPCFFAGNSAAIAALFAPWPAEVCQVDSAMLA